MRSSIRNHVPIVAAIALLVAAMPASAHLFNHQDRHEVCDIYGDPAGHSADDGHAHYHHLAASATGHLHGGAYFPAGHTHPDVFHDPCDQAGVKRVSFQDAPAFSAPPFPRLVMEEPVQGTLSLILRDALEGVVLPAPVTMRDELVIRSDADLARFPGSGTPSDPYVISGYHIRHELLIKDTSMCIVIRDNVIYNDVVRGPVLDPRAIADLQKVVERAVANLTSAEGALAEAEAALATVEATLLGVEGERATREASLAAIDARWDELQDATAHAWNSYVAARDATTSAMEAVRGETRSLRAALATQGVMLPAEPPATTQPGDPAFRAFASDVQEIADAPPQPDATVATHAARLAELRAALDARESELAAADEAHEASLAARDAYEPIVTAANAAHEAWLGEVRAPAVARVAAAQTAFDGASQLVAAQSASLADAELRFAAHPLEYLGVGFDTLDEVARYAVSLIPAPEQDRGGRLILDWNGQCVHAYHNVIQDLRVNRNNDRTGFATGGLLEDNRIFTIGQIRHYDGEFRENEIGDRRYIQAYLNGTLADHTLDSGDDLGGHGGPEMATLRTGRAINADGFNEAWMHHNVIYGAVDLDLHGHHHGAGFFARESHYHGSSHDVAYMVNATTGECQFTQPTPPGKLSQVGVDHALPVVDDHEERCLPHHDHAKRWTSVRFEHNMILDPAGYGLRYEDQNHAGDDRVAASESTIELNKPHFHKTHIALANNILLGNVWIDVFNSHGIDLWSDDHSAVRRSPTGLVLDVAEHPTAHIVNSHPGRNDGWLDITDNTIVVIDKEQAVRWDHDDWTAIQILHAKELNRTDILRNSAFYIGRSFQPGTHDTLAFAAKLREIAAMDPHAAFAEVKSWGGVLSAGASHAIILHRIADSTITVCGNTMLGFSEGFEAIDDIRPDVGFTDCGDNDWGAATPPFNVLTTPYPPPGLDIFATVTDATAGTPVGGHVHSAADHARVLAGH